MYNPIDSNAVESIERAASVRRVNPRPAEQPQFAGRPATVEEWPIRPRAGYAPRFDLKHSSRWLRRRAWWIVLAAILGAVGGFVFVSLVKPDYTVSTEVLVDPSNLKVISDDLFTQSQQRDSQLLDVETKLRILTSATVLARPPDHLNLHPDPEFAAHPGGPPLPALLP